LKSPPGGASMQTKKPLANEKKEFLRIF